MPIVTACHATPPCRIWPAVSVTCVPADAALSDTAVDGGMLMPAIPFAARPVSVGSTFPDAVSFSVRSLAPDPPEHPISVARSTTAAALRRFPQPSRLTPSENVNDMAWPRSA
jgi:hypothetical protein